MRSSTSVLPAPYFYFFWLLEPILTVAGGVSAIYDPISFGGNTLPRNIERATLKMGNTVRGQIVVSELGSCFLLLAMISFSLFYLFKKHLDDKPVLQEKLVKGLLIPLAIADLLHIAVTLLPLPMSHLENPSQWTYILHSTVWITSSLFIVRLAWLFGIGRATAKSMLESRRSPTRQARLPLPKGNSEAMVEQVIQTEKPREHTAVESPATIKKRGRAKKIVDDD
ncbi:hypothetical protein I312_105272 [Cryptococcus bacillisporus CA1280]|uniref:DUF7704 domain-containing protein n=2 Tax=Cryptococcus gattii TaxID=552467 RepID=A0A0D0UHM4_CRYGA|nr:hypothetical protein I312_02860 [Cryptococcus bacillisporus CA1280]KIR63776.1 hypothetical protein I314_03182 [Cryptococcus bacillisporus CA1873]|eukprot:KIR63776.1 hypothetical protein I314_03182 [Cryptococcus gattii CA1873]